MVLFHIEEAQRQLYPDKERVCHIMHASIQETQGEEMLWYQPLQQ